MKPFTWQARVYYEDTDAGGVVYYANYLKFMERARTEWLRSLGIEQDKIAADSNVLFAVRSVNIEFKLPARFNDHLSISVEPHNLKPASISFAQSISRESTKELLVQGDVNIVCVGKEKFAPKAIPPNIYEEIKRAC